MIGPAADDPDAMLGNYNGIPSHVVTPLAGIEREFGTHSRVQFSLGSSYVAGWSALVPQNVLTTGEQDPQAGLRVEYFNNRDFSGSPAISRIEPRGYFNWEMQEPALGSLQRQAFSVRWTGYLHPSASGEYQLGVIRPECHACGRIDAARVWVNGKLLVADTTKPGEQIFARTTPLVLAAGQVYALRIEYTQKGGGGGLHFVWTPPAEPARQDAVTLAQNSDVVVLCVGLNSLLEGEESPLKVPGFAGGDRTDLRLPEPQRALLAAILATGKPVIVVLVNGSALAIPDAKEKATAIVESWYGGQEAGTAVADVLAGKWNPSGRLPVTFYASVDDLPPFTDYAMKNRTYRFFKGEPLYPFGYGLTYSKFEYSAGTLDGSTVTATVKNVSEREGDEVAQLYLVQEQTGAPELRGFKRIHLKPGQSQTLTFRVDPRELAGRRAAVGGGQPFEKWTGRGYVQIAEPSRK